MEGYGAKEGTNKFRERSVGDALVANESHYQIDRPPAVSILRPIMKHAITYTALFFSVLPILPPSSASASERRFAYTYPSLTAPAGEIEYENWVTWKSRAGAIRNFDVRHEIEIGLTSKTQLGLYFANWAHDARSHESSYQNSAVEVIHNLTNPVTDFLGSAIYGEFSVGERHATLEGKLLLEKRIGQWVVGWNGILESEWEGDRFGDLQESAGELSQTAGVSYDLTKNISLGAEIVHKMPLGKWHGVANAEVYAGPNVTVRKGRFYSTLTALFQATDKTSQAAIQIRSIVGVDF